MGWTAISNPLLQTHSMTTSATRPVSLTCVPVSTTETGVAKVETGSTPLVGANHAHQKRIIGVLVHTYGWLLGQDGNLYAPDASMAWGGRVS